MKTSGSSAGEGSDSGAEYVASSLMEQDIDAVNDPTCDHVSESVGGEHGGYSDEPSEGRLHHLSSFNTC